MNTHLSLLLVGLLSTLPAIAGADTLERVRSSHTLTLGYLPDFAPFSSDSGGKPEGYAIELCNQVADYLRHQPGLDAVKVQFKAVSRAESITAVSSGSIDLLCTPTPQTLERRKTVSFSIPVYTAGLAAVVRQNAADDLVRVLNGETAHEGPTWRATINRGIARHTFATTAGGVTEAWIHQQVNRLGVVVNLISVSNDADGVRQVAQGNADAFFSERMLLKHYLSQDPDGAKLKVLNRIFDYSPTAMALPRGDEDFHLLVDSALSALYRSGEIDQAYSRYFGPPDKTLQDLHKVYALP
ncbi:amino acid ABC transporter substrate-binding protein [Pseudomonas sp. GV071]|jgi:polar amino acid transport system substrate-binding protein|uniref:amino acid ABC transporter substrate-binding protein n=1 Tax=Pseudomonas sp. GV071 TaxID=2135754 RepID=UPI000D3C5B6B|nr:amino acid ABC transporter substrate-binding protein [Pseudomonas sp. GV071]PTQ66902.1 amino acid ABC transporter substrate-binding protein (PAAT family) [Pseudomonas sp. GV071]